MFLYIITNTVNGKKYVGQTRVSLHKRFINHCARKDERSQSYISNAIQKYGKENFIMEPLLEIDSQDVLNELESEFIAQFCTLSPNGYNLTTGGESPRLNDDTKAKLRAARLGKKLTRAHRKKISESLRASEAFKAAHAARRGLKPSLEARQKMSAAHKGKRPPSSFKYNWTPEMRQAARERMLGNKHLQGHHPTEETKRKIADSMAQTRAKRPWSTAPKEAACQPR